MKELRVGDIAIFTEDDDTWDDIVKVVKKANKAYMESVNSTRQTKKESWLRNLISWTKGKLFRCQIGL